MDKEFEDIDDYTEARFELNEWLNRRSKKELIVYVNYLINIADADVFPLVIGGDQEEELKQILEEDTENGTD